MPFYRSPDKKYRSIMPSYTEWDRLSGGADDNNIPLLQYINKRMYEHSIYARMVTQHGKMEAERLCCLIQIWYAARMYIKSCRKTGTFSRNMRSSIRADGFKKIDLGGQGHVSRIEVIEALESLVTQELMGLTGAPNRDAVKTKIRQSEVLQMSDHGRGTDSKTSKDGRLLRTYLSTDERAQYRLLLEGSAAKMHPRHEETDPLDWIAADTRGSNSNECFKDWKSLQQKSELEVQEGRAEFEEFYRYLYPHGLEGFVMTHSRKLFMSNDHNASNTATGVTGFFHSAYTAGEGVVCSGSICFDHGKPTAITNLSGHYQPKPEKLDRVIRLFEMSGVPIGDLSILVTLGEKVHSFYKSDGGNHIQRFRSDIRGATHNRLMH